METDKQILIMDDDPHVCDYLTDLIHYFGLEVECVHACDSALHRLKEKTYDALLLDRWMEDGQGDAILDWLRENRREERAIIMSVLADYDMWMELMDKGAVDLLSKPVQPAQLKRALQLALGPEHFVERGHQPILGN